MNRNGRQPTFLRLNPDGSLDHSFRLGRPVGGVDAIASQADGSVLIGGDFLQFDGAIRPYVARSYGDSARPALSITRSNSVAVVSWPASFGNFHLQENTNDSLANGWSAVTQLVVTNGNQVSVTAPATAGRQFFRLKSQ